MQRDGQEERAGAQARRRGDPRLRLCDLQRQDQNSHGGKDDNGKPVVRRPGLRRGRQGLRPHGGDDHEERQGHGQDLVVKSSLLAALLCSNTTLWR
eukprot:15609996-Heterocapsa_arctica.AAC.1